MRSKWSAPILSIQRETVFVHDLTAITPLGGQTPVVETIGPITLTEVTDRALASVTARQGRLTEAAQVLETVLGAALPDTQRCIDQPLGAFWAAPDQWMIEAPISSHEDLAHQLMAAANGTFSVTEQTDAWCRFDLAGDGLADLFERLCPAPVRAFQGGEAVRSTIDHLGCFVICRTPTRISVLGPRSSAGSLHHALITAMRSVY